MVRGAYSNPRRNAHVHDTETTREPIASYFLDLSHPCVNPFPRIIIKSTRSSGQAGAVSTQFRNVLRRRDLRPMISGSKLLIAAAVLACLTAGAWWAMPWGALSENATWDRAVEAAKQGRYELMHTDEIRQLLEEAPQKLVVVDLRNREDYRQGHIPGAINIPLESGLWNWLGGKQRLAAALGPDKSRYAVMSGADLACTRSEYAARIAAELGYSHVFRHAKGFADWKEERLRVSKTSVEQPGRHKTDPSEPLVLGWAMIGTLLSIFIGGIALNLTPCVYPLVPITVAYFGTRKGQSRFAIAGHGLLYVCGLALTNSVLGVVASLTGGLIGSALQNPLVLVLVALVLLILASSLFGYWEFRLPTSITTMAARPYAGYAGSLFMGLTLGVVAAPCVGPFILGLLTWVAKMGDPLMGFLVFFTLSLGLGLPIFVLAIVSGSLGSLPASGAWMTWVRKLMGWVLVGMAAYFIGPLLPRSYDVMLLSAVIVAASLHLGWIDSTQAGFKGFRLARMAVMAAGLVWAGIMVGSLTHTPTALSWHAYSDKILSRATEERKPVIMDFFASWCGPCRQMEHETFSNPEVIKEAQNGFVMVKVDLTRAADGENEKLLRRFNITGVPTVVFLDANGRERTDLRLVGATPPDVFLGRMAEIK